MRSKKERLAQAGLLELGGILLVAPLSALVTGHDLASMGSLAVVMSTLAVIWSTVWNWMFDRWVPTRQRSVAQRIAQALGFELGLVLVTSSSWLPGSTSGCGRHSCWISASLPFSWSGP